MTTPASAPVGTMPTELNRLDYFAAMALQGLLIAGKCNSSGCYISTPQDAVKFAQNLVIELDKVQPAK